MAYTILPATPADLPEIVACHQATFADDPFIGLLMPNVLPEVKQSHDMHYFGRQFEMSRFNGMKHRKAVDGEGCGSSPARLAFDNRTMHSLTCKLGRW